MFDFIADLILALANQGAGAASVALSYQPETPASLMSRED